MAFDLEDFNTVLFSQLIKRLRRTKQHFSSSGTGNQFPPVAWRLFFGHTKYSSTQLDKPALNRLQRFKAFSLSTFTVNVDICLNHQINKPIANYQYAQKK
jgi:hypothetical protein